MGRSLSGAEASAPSFGLGAGGGGGDNGETLIKAIDRLSEKFLWRSFRVGEPRWVHGFGAFTPDTSNLPALDVPLRSVMREQLASKVWDYCDDDEDAWPFAREAGSATRPHSNSYLPRLQVFSPSLSVRLVRRLLGTPAGLDRLADPDFSDVVTFGTQQLARIEVLVSRFADIRALAMAMAAFLGVPISTFAFVPCSGLRAQTGAGAAHEAMIQKKRWGTVGGVGRCPETGRLLAISGNHVFAMCNAGLRGQDLVQFSNGTPLGLLHDFTQLLPPPDFNEVDLAFARVDDPSSLGTPPPTFSHVREPKRNMDVGKLGAATRHTDGRVASVYSTAIIEFLDADGKSQEFQFRRGFRVVPTRAGRPFSRGGDSGSFIYESGTTHLVGIVVAGDEKGAYTFACRATALQRYAM